MMKGTPRVFRSRWGYWRRVQQQSWSR